MIYIWTTTSNSNVVDLVAPLLKGVSHVHVTQFPASAEGEPGSVVLAMGADIIDQLKAWGAVPKNVGIEKLKNKLIEVGGVGVIPAYSPGIAKVDPTRVSEIAWSVNLARRYIETGDLVPNLGDYRWVEDFTDAINCIEAQYAKTGKPVVVVGDLETVGLYPWYEDVWIVSMSITVEAGRSDLLYFTQDFQPDRSANDQRGLLWEQIQWLHRSEKVMMRGANYKFDLEWMAEKWGIECTNFSMDTMLVGSLLDENRSNSLNMHTKEYVPDLGGYDDAFNDTYDKSKMHLVPKEALLPYAGGDTDAGYRVSEIVKPQLLQDQHLASFYVNLLHPAARVFEKVERRGMVVDRERYLALREEMVTEMAEWHDKALSMIPKRLHIKYEDNLSLTRDALIKDFLFTPYGLDLEPIMYTPKAKDRSPKYASTAMDHLKQFSEVPEAAEFIEALREYNSIKKMVSTYIDGFMKHLRPDCRFHPTYHLAATDDGGTVTGRLSARDPAFQTIPKHNRWAKKLRSVYVPPPGYGILQPDFSQGELRIAAVLANEPTMLEAYSRGLDLHAITAAGLVEMTFEEFMALPEEERDHLRFAAKAANFGLLYGMGAAGFQAYAKSAYGVEFTDSEAVHNRERFFGTYSRLQPWHDEVKEFAHQWEAVRSPLGRIRHLPLINSRNNEVRSKQERQAVNSPVQGCLSDMMLLSMVELDRQYPDLWMFGMTHDSLSMYVPLDEMDVWAVRVKEVMENLPLGKFGWEPPIKFVADVEASEEDLGKLHKLKLAA